MPHQLTTLPLSASQKQAAVRSERAVLSQLATAALQGDFATLQQGVNAYCNDHPDLDRYHVLAHFRDGHGRTVLHFACQSAAAADVVNDGTYHDDIVEQILHWLTTTAPSSVPPSSDNNGSSWHTLLSIKDKDGLTPLMLAAQHSDRLVSERRVGALLRAASSSSSCAKLGLARSHAGATALHYAAGAAATRKCVLQLFAEAKIALHTFSKQGGTPLHWACAVRENPHHLETIRALLECGANVQATSASIPPPLLIAMAAGNQEAALLLLQSNSSNSAIDWSPTLQYILSPGGFSVFHLAADMNMVNVLKNLLSKIDGISNNSYLLAMIQRANDEQLTPLQLAERENHVECVQLLLPYTQQQQQQQQQHEARKDSTIVSDEIAPADQETVIDPVATPLSTPVNVEHGEENPLALVESRARDHAQQIITSLESGNVLLSTYNTAMHEKESGNDLFANKEYQRAMEQYQTGIVQLEQELLSNQNSCSTTDCADANSIRILLATLYSNKSACAVLMHQQKQEQQQQSSSPPSSIDDSSTNTLVLRDALHDAVVSRTFRPDWAKAFYRVAVAQYQLKQFEDAAVTAWEGWQLETKNMELQRLLQQCVKEGRADFLSIQDKNKVKQK